MVKFKQLVLLILDGFGVASPSEGNAVTAASPRNLNYLINHFPSITLQASGPAVGLSWGVRGNSEVGHLNLGAGRIVTEDYPRISQSIGSGKFFQNPSFLAAASHVKKNKSKLHLVGLVSPGGVHSAEEHLYAFLGFAAEQELKDVFVHMFTDGRDTSAKVAQASIDRLARKFLEFGVGKIATVSGRFYAMDRGGHWEETEKTYAALVNGEGEKFSSPREAVQKYYDRQIFDETIPPTVIVDGNAPLAQIGEGDAVIFFNFRPDRMVQLVRSFTDPAFDKFSKKYPFLQNVFYVTMTQYEAALSVSVAFSPIEINMGLSETLSKTGLRQFHIAESEKYAHVTSFFNGGREAPWPLEERDIVTSPAAYQKRYEDVPEMSVDEIGKTVVQKLKAGTNFILANIANPDMVGHTGNKAACIKAVEAVDRNLGMIFEEAAGVGACCVIVSDHGNIEQVIDPRTGRIDKEHSLNPVPLVVAGVGLERKRPLTRGYLELPALVPEGVLSDVSPTVLELLGVQKPIEMTSISLLEVLLKQTD